MRFRTKLCVQVDCYEGDGGIMVPGILIASQNSAYSRPSVQLADFPRPKPGPTRDVRATSSSNRRAARRFTQCGPT